MPPIESDALVCIPHKHHFGSIHSYPQTCPVCQFFTHCPTCFAKHECPPAEPGA